VKYIVTVEGQEIPVEVDGQEVRVAGRTVEAHLSPVPGTPLRHLLLGGESLTLAMRRPEAGKWEAQFRGTSYLVEVVDQRTRHIRSLTAGAARPDASAQVKAPMPGLVVRVLVEPGQQVQAGQGLVVLEAMKMENELKAKANATIRSVSVNPGQAVEKGQVLIEFEV
jgi:pyruvate carboxylase subunit B